MKYIRKREDFHRYNVSINEDGSDKIYDGTWQDTLVGRLLSFGGNIINQKVKGYRIGRHLNKLKEEVGNINKKKLEQDDRFSEVMLYQSISQFIDYINDESSDFTIDTILDNIDITISNLDTEYKNKSTEFLRKDILNKFEQLKSEFENINESYIKESLNQEGIDKNLDEISDIIDMYTGKRFKGMDNVNIDNLHLTGNNKVYDKLINDIKATLDEMNSKLRQTLPYIENEELKTKTSDLIRYISKLPYGDYKSFSKIFDKDLKSKFKDIITISGNLYDDNIRKEASEKIKSKLSEIRNSDNHTLLKTTDGKYLLVNSGEVNEEDWDKYDKFIISTDDEGLEHMFDNDKLKMTSYNGRFNDVIIDKDNNNSEEDDKVTPSEKIEIIGEDLILNDENLDTSEVKILTGGSELDYDRVVVDSHIKAGLEFKLGYKGGEYDYDVFEETEEVSDNDNEVKVNDNSVVFKGEVIPASDITITNSEEQEYSAEEIMDNKSLELAELFKKVMNNPGYNVNILDYEPKEEDIKIDEEDISDDKGGAEEKQYRKELFTKFKYIFNDYITTEVIKESLDNEKIKLRDNIKEIIKINKRDIKEASTIIKTPSDINLEKEFIHNLSKILKDAHSLYAIPKSEYDAFTQRFGEKRGRKKQRLYEVRGDWAVYKDVYKKWYKGVMDIIRDYGETLTKDTNELLIDSINNIDISKLINDRLKKAYGIEIKNDKLDGSNRKSSVKSLKDQKFQKAITQDSVLEWQSVKQIEPSSSKSARTGIKIYYIDDNGDKNWITAYASKAKSGNGFIIKFVKGNSDSFLKNYSTTLHSGVNKINPKSVSKSSGTEVDLDVDNLNVFTGKLITTREGSSNLMKGKFVISEIIMNTDSLKQPSIKMNVDKLYLLCGEEDKKTYIFPTISEDMNVKKYVNSSKYDRWVDMSW